VRARAQSAVSCLLLFVALLFVAPLFVALVFVAPLFVALLPDT
jgi:hypothetical protein